MLAQRLSQEEAGLKSSFYFRWSTPVLSLDVFEFHGPVLHVSRDGVLWGEITVSDVRKSCQLFFTLWGCSGAYRTDLAPDLTPTSASRVTVAIKMKLGDAQIVELFKQVLHSHLMCGLCKGSIVSQEVWYCGRSFLLAFQVSLVLRAPLSLLCGYANYSHERI